MSLERKAPLKRTEFKKMTPKPLKRTTGLRPRSTKTIREAPIRAAVIAETHQRSGGKCEIAHLIPEIPQCWGPLDCDEIKSRGVNKGGHLDVTNTQSACRAHHRWRTEHPKLARERGLRKASWE